MFFKTKEKKAPEKKNAAADSQEGPSTRAPRYRSIARVSINGFEGEAVLRNVSIGGFRMESRTYVAMQVGEQYTMRIQPEASANVKAFELDVEVRWIQSGETSFAAGFLVISVPAGNFYEKYVDSIKAKEQS
jgi:hypothetical protein